MTDTTMSQEYLTLAKRFADHAALLEALQCASAALQLDGSTDRAVRALLERLSSSGRGSLHEVGGAPPLLQHRKSKLDRALSGLAAVRDESLECLAREVQLGSGQSDRPGHEFGRGLARLLSILRRDGIAEDSALFARLRETAGHLSIELGSLTPDEPGPASGDTWEPSLEHEAHKLGNDVYRCNRFEAAVALYSLALEVRPDLLEAIFNRGLAHTRMGAYPLAAKDLAEVIRLNPNLAEAYYTLGLIEEYQGNFDQAIAGYEKALSVDPGYEKARTQLLEAERKRARASSSTPPAGGPNDDSGLVRDFSAYLVRPTGGFSRVGGCSVAKQELRFIAEQLRGNRLFEKWGIQMPRGVILHGPPGTGKSLLAESLAAEVRCPFYSPPVGIYHSMWAGNTEANLRRLWAEASAHPAAVIFFDEFDSLASQRADTRAGGMDWYNRIVGALLALLSTSKDGLVVIAATNSLHNVDRAFLRPGRFDYLIPVDAPTEDDLVEIWSIHLSQAEEAAERVPLLEADLRDALLASDRSGTAGVAATGRMPLRELARLSHEKGFTGADVREVVRRAAKTRMAIEYSSGADVGPISAEDLHHEITRYQVPVYRHESWGAGPAQAF